MNIEASESRFIDADPSTIYRLIADYHALHPRILPPRYFGWLRVEEGGVGEGTRIRFSMKSFGTEREMVAFVTEPEPGRVLVEQFQDGSGVTTFVTERSGAGTLVTIRTVLSRPGIRGLLERLVVPRFLRRVYREELELLARIAREDQGGDSA